MLARKDAEVMLTSLLMPSMEKNTKCTNYKPFRRLLIHVLTRSYNPWFTVMILVILWRDLMLNKKHSIVLSKMMRMHLGFALKCMSDDGPLTRKNLKLHNRRIRDYYYYEEWKIVWEICQYMWINYDPYIEPKLTMDNVPQLQPFFLYNNNNNRRVWLLVVVVMWAEIVCVCFWAAGLYL